MAQISANSIDKKFMHIALRHAQRGIGITGTNPSVGCVIVNENGHIIAATRTANGGRPHAEARALEIAGGKAHGATLYVTLEPCAHHGKTPPCAEAVIRAGIKRVVIATKDPFEEVNGKGITLLQDAGIEVSSGVCEKQAMALHAGFFLNQTQNRPLITLKLASTLDGKIANSARKSQWITGDIARDVTHRMRFEHDAIMVGIGTVLADDPSLTCRTEGLESYSPTRVIVDSRLRIPTDAKCIKDADQTPTRIYTTRDIAADGRKPATVIQTNTDKNNQVNLHDTLQDLCQHGIKRVLVEGGSTLAAALLKEDLIDEIMWFHSQQIMGAKGLDAVGNAGTHIENAALQRNDVFEHINTMRLGDDTLTHLRRKSLASLCYPQSPK